MKHVITLSLLISVPVCQAAQSPHSQQVPLTEPSAPAPHELAQPLIAHQPPPCHNMDEAAVVERRVSEIRPFCQIHTLHHRGPAENITKKCCFLFCCGEYRKRDGHSGCACDVCSDSCCKYNMPISDRDSVLLSCVEIAATESDVHRS